MLVLSATEDVTIRPTAPSIKCLTKTMNDNSFRALAHEQRRTLLLDVLRAHPQDVVVESPAREGAVTDADRREQLEMYHSHLPKLEAYGFIEWNKDIHEVGKGPRFEELRPLLECVDTHAEIANQNDQPRP